MCEKVASMPIRKRHREWVKVWRKKKSVNGSYSFLTKDLSVYDKPNYRNYLRMSETQFNLLLSFISQDLLKQDTRMRDAITPAEKVAVTLRFLATGKLQTSPLGFIIYLHM